MRKYTLLELISLAFNALFIGIFCLFVLLLIKKNETIANFQDDINDLQTKKIEYIHRKAVLDSILVDITKEIVTMKLIEGNLTNELTFISNSTPEEILTKYDKQHYSLGGEQ